MPERIIRVQSSADSVCNAVATLLQEACAHSISGHDILTETGLAVLEQIRDAFVIKARGGTDAAGDKWAPLRPSTLQRRRARKPPNLGTEILHDTGLLLGSLSPSAAPGTPPYQIFQPGPGHVILGTSRAGAIDHHRGNPTRSLPQRRLWPEPRRWPAQWWTGILEKARDTVVDALVESIERAK